MVLSGEVDATSADRLTESVVEVLGRRKPRRLEIDLGGVTFLDSAGIRALVRCHADAQQADCPLTLSAPRPMVYRVLEITGLLEYFGVTKPQPSGRPRQERRTRRQPSRSSASSDNRWAADPKLQSDNPPWVEVHGCEAETISVTSR